MVRLELRAVEKRWPGALIHVDLAAETGSVLAVAGPSGCGKTTALRIAAGLETPDSGSVLVGGVDVTGSEPSARGIGMVFQDCALFPHLDVSGNIEYGLKARRVGRSERKARVSSLLETFGLAGFERRRADSLSGGERQRVALARTLAAGPGIVLFDEPFSSLDASLRKRLRAELAFEQRRLGFTAILVTHDLEEAMALGDALAVMDRGRVLQLGPPSLLWTRPDDARVARFMGSGPTLEILSIATDEGRRWASTATGRFELGPSALDAVEPPGARRFIHFERSAASIERGAGAPPGGAGSGFAAECVRADFAGDSVECSMRAGSETFALRFARGAAPIPGTTLRYSVPARELIVIPELRTR